MDVCDAVVSGRSSEMTPDSTKRSRTDIDGPSGGRDSPTLLAQLRRWAVNTATKASMAYRSNHHLLHTTPAPAPHQQSGTGQGVTPGGKKMPHTSPVSVLTLPALNMSLDTTLDDGEEVG